MKPFHARRLKRLIDFLEQLPRAKFNFGRWTAGWDPKHECGTAACAMGWAGTIPFFQKLGVSVKRARDPYGADDWTSALVCVDPEDGARRNEQPVTAAARIFGVSGEEAAFLFLPDRWFELGGETVSSPDRYATPKKVAKHLRRFLKHEGFEALADA